MDVIIILMISQMNKIAKRKNSICSTDITYTTEFFLSSENNFHTIILSHNKQIFYNES